MEPVEEVVRREQAGLGFDRVELLAGATFKDATTIIVVPTRGLIHTQVIQAWDCMLAPMNQRRVKLYAKGFEVGDAYNKMIRMILDNPHLSTYRYVLSLEDDNLPPPDAHMKLIESIELGPFDAVGGLYFTKGDVNMPMAYGDPKKVEPGSMDFAPRDVVEASKTGNVVEVNGVGMGCTLWRMDLFREFSPPWFVTVCELIDGKGGVGITQDLYFCERIRRAGKRIAVDLRVKVGHMDVETEIIY